MSQAMAEVVGYVNRSRAFMPPGAVPPFIMRFEAGSVPVAQLVFSSASRTPGEMQDIALNRVRPIFATLPGVSAPPPFGGSQRSIVVRVDPEKMRSYRISPEDVVTIVNRGSIVLPSGNVRTGDLLRISSTNAALGGNIQELLDTPLRMGSGPSVYLRDIATVSDTTDLIVGYAHVDGKRTVYIPVTKRADASTLDVVRRVRDALPKMRAVAPEDVKIDLVFDQSSYVVAALRSLIFEGTLGAVLTGLMVLLFLREWRSSLIVVATIPFALLGAVVGLWALDQTINIMTLGGLALAVGVLVDQATVVIESIHTHRAEGMSKARAVVEASKKTAFPLFLAMLCILAVFLPSFFMAGTAKQLFVPLSLAVGLAMVVSYLLSGTLVPVLAARFMKDEHAAETQGWFEKVRSRYTGYLDKVHRGRWALVIIYILICGGLIAALLPWIGTEIFPAIEGNQIQLRLRAPVGTRVEKTELLALRAMDVIKQTVGPDNVEITTGFIGVATPNYPINPIYLFTNGQHEAVLKVALKSTVSRKGAALEEELRGKLKQALPNTTVSFEPADIIGQVMSFGSPTPIEVAVQSPNLALSRPFAEKVRAQLAQLPFLRDLQYAQPLDYPTIDVEINRDRAGQFGLAMADVAKSLVPVTSSSRNTDLNFWRDPRSGNAFQIQVEVPQNRIASLEDMQGIPVMRPDGVNNSVSRPLLADVATLRYGTTFGEVDRYNMQRVISFTANVYGVPLGKAVTKIQNAVTQAGEAPRGVNVFLRGQVPAFEETLSGLRTGLLFAVVVIFLLLAANYESLRLALAVVSTVPAVILGVLLMLLLTGTTLNVQSFMGAIMAVGISVANAILLVTYAEAARRDGRSVPDAAREGASGRLRPILMTAFAMMAGMVPMALSYGEGAQAAPLGRAVIGGLLAATAATLLVLPAVYVLLQSRVKAQSVSLNPDNPASKYYDRG
jgi:multidrug efflux pump subunit AcrB